MDTRLVKVAARVQETEDICVLDLVAADGGVLPRFSAGAHIDVHLPGGLTRQYSLCNDPADASHYKIGVLREPGGRGGSLQMHLLKPGDTVRISTPRNHFPLAHNPSKSLLIAGGIGITPILCMAERLAFLDLDFELHYCARSVSRTAFRNRIASSNFASKVIFHFDDMTSRRLDISTLLSRQDADTHLYVCGPKGLMDAVLTEARRTGWSEERLRYEFFSGPAVTGSATDSTFTVRVASSGLSIPVEANQTIVQALATAGVFVPTSCEQGVCGTCLTRVLQGDPDHRDLYLTEEEKARNDMCLPCCSRAKSAVLVLDL